MTATTTVCFDIGRTSCRARAYDGYAPDGPRPTSDPYSVASGTTLADLDGPAVVARLVADGLSALGGGTAAGSMVVGVAGGLEDPTSMARLADLLVSDHRQPVTVTGDIVAAHAGSLGGGRGVVVVAGTGAVALAVDAAGRVTKVDGNGYLIGDAGSGFSVGRAGLESALRHHDGRPGGSAVLASAAEARFGDLRTFPTRLQAGADAARKIASFALDVAEQARAGDRRSSEIWRRAVDDLAEAVVAAGRAVAADGLDNPVAVTLTGGLFDTTDLLTAPLCARLQSRFPGIGTGQGDALLGAARIASGPAGVYEPLLVRRPDPPQTSTASATKGKPEEARR